MNLVKRLANFGSKFIDYKMGFIGAFVMAAIVFGINFTTIEEISGAITAALKQGGYTFLLGGSFMKGCEILATKIKNPALAIFLAVFIPSAITLVLTYNVHKIKGTPKPLESTIPTLIIIPATAVWGYKKRNQFVLENTIEEFK